MCLIPMGLWRMVVLGNLLEMGFSRAAVEAAMMAKPERWSRESVKKWAEGLVEECEEKNS